ncbi:Putative ML-like domain, transient receptor potential channel Flc/Pkd2 [Septoria linicola]|uniref:ML-like domain, transient receptor potential channel Flc/Pkd2 n=1 Tax=Septoria linicola TaxID=215465 RepID=A0A9Q9ENE1_9PEZI|nr:putative ML-like domain, transient receptor potential channel Flc/Pkd2 [Septoria linicola]USW56522.1 Putative ML-like domain, transient receptor potential channel Flc/Pkd2 [Septoria linicola]
MRNVRQILLPLLLSALPASVLAADVLSTDGYQLCSTSDSIKVEALDASYDRNTRKITFDVAGSSSKEQKVLLNLVVTAYGKQVYQADWDPCSSDRYVEQMCPIPSGSFASKGSQTIPEEYASQIPSIAFNVPDLEGLVKLEVKSAAGGEDIACVQSTVGNGKTINLPSVGYAAAGVAAAALAMSAVGALAAGGGGAGASTPSPTFTEVIGWFQGMAMNGMLSVQYPKIYQSFTTNFAFSTGLVPWGRMQTAIDNFRASTGGNITDNNYKWLRNNVTLVYSDGSNSSVTKRGLENFVLWARDGTTTSVNGTEVNIGDSGSTTSSNSSATDEKDQHFVQGIQAYVERLSIPSSNTFMTVLLVWAIVVAAIIVLILLFKAILEAWGQCGKLSPYFESWRKRYWWRMAKAITNLVLMLYGVWTLYCVYQFTSGDSWAAKVLAGVTFALFTALLGFFTFKIWSKANQFKKMEGDTTMLYENKDVWLKYSLFYDNYKKGYWWIFMPTIVYMFARGCIIAGANGHGLIQAAGQLIVEALMLILLLWARPYNRTSGKWINITIQTVRVLSVVCVLVFVQELGLTQTTQTVTGLVLIVVQSVMTGLLAILIAVNAIITCVKENPHRKARKEREKMNRDLDALTPLDARNSLLMTDVKHPYHEDTSYKAAPLVSSSPFAPTRGRYDPVEQQRRVESPARFHDDDHLMSSAASMGRQDHYRDHSRGSSVSRERDMERQPRLPDLSLGRAL